MKFDILASLIIAALILYLVYREWAALKATVHTQGERIAKLEESSRLRMPRQAMESILDARAALNKYKEEVQYELSLIENAEGHLGNALTSGTKQTRSQD